MSEPVPADVLRAVAHPLRLALLVALEEREQTPSELATALDAARSSVEHHLAILHDAGLARIAGQSGQWRTVDGWTEISAALERLQGS